MVKSSFPHHVKKLHDHFLKCLRVKFIGHLCLNENIRHVNTENSEYIRPMTSFKKKYYAIALTFPGSIFIRLFRKVRFFRNLGEKSFTMGVKLITILAVRTCVNIGYNRIENKAWETKSINTPIAFIM